MSSRFKKLFLEKLTDIDIQLDYRGRNRENGSIFNKNKYPI